MDIELSNANGPVFLEFELYGQFSTDELFQIADQFSDDAAIQKISVEIATENPATLRLPAFEEYVSEQDGELSVSSSNAATDAGGSSADRPTDSDPSPRLQPGSDPFSVVRLVDHHDDWLRTSEIVETIPDEWDVSEGTLNSTLWSLTDRGLLDKRPYEDDKRQNEYRITDLGERTLEQAVERADDLPPLD